MTADLVTSLDGRCAYAPPARGQCKRRGNMAVAGVEHLLCKQHARIVATEPGQSGVIRTAPIGPAAIATELAAASTHADIDRCRGAIARQLDVCSNSFGLLPEVAIALTEARARVNGGSR